MTGIIHGCLIRRFMRSQCLLVAAQTYARVCDQVCDLDSVMEFDLSVHVLSLSPGRLNKSY